MPKKPHEKFEELKEINTAMEKSGIERSGEYLHELSNLTDDLINYKYAEEAHASTKEKEETLNMAIEEIHKIESYLILFPTKNKKIMEVFTKLETEVIHELDEIHKHGGAGGASGTGEKAKSPRK